MCYYSQQNVSDFFFLLENVFRSATLGNPTELGAIMQHFYVRDQDIRHKSGYVRNKSPKESLNRLLSRLP